MLAELDKLSTIIEKIFSHLVAVNPREC